MAWNWYSLIHFVFEQSKTLFPEAYGLDEFEETKEDLTIEPLQKDFFGNDIQIKRIRDKESKSLSTFIVLSKRVVTTLLPEVDYLEGELDDHWRRVSKLNACYVQQAWTGRSTGNRLFIRSDASKLAADLILKLETKHRGMHQIERECSKSSDTDSESSEDEETNSSQNKTRDVNTKA